MATPDIDVVVITQGADLEGLRRCLESLQAQEGVVARIICLGNGYKLPELPEGIETHHVPDNLGAPQGRNVAAGHGNAPLILFFDDDAWFSDPKALASLVTYMEKRPRVGLVQPRIVDPQNGRTEPRWVPRSIVGDPARPSLAFTISEGVSLVRRELFESVGGWADFFYGHEGIELTWQVWNSGRTARYLPQVVAHHPSGAPFRRPNHMWMNARNRVWVARRNLPQPVRTIYLLNWWLISMLRLNRNRAARKEWLQGWRAGRKTSSESVAPRLSWRTILRLTLAGHPPIV